MNIKQLVTHACSLSAVIAVAACTNPDPVGDLIVPFEIGAGIECSLKNVVDVDVTLLKINGADDEVEDVAVESVKVPCGEGKAVFTDVPVGKYEIRAEGYDADNFVVVDNGGSAEPEIGEVLEGRESTVSPAITMTSTPAQLWVRFKLNKDTFPAMCAQVPLTKLAVTAYKNSGADPLLRVDLACDAAPEDDTYHHLADPDRDLDGAVFDYIRVQPHDVIGNIIGADVKYPLAMAPGAGRTVKLTFIAECASDKCDLQCNDAACTPD